MMPEAVVVLYGAALTAVVCLAAGESLLLRLGLWSQKLERLPLAFLVGTACLSLAVLVLSVFGLARSSTFLLVAAAALAGRVWAGRRAGPKKVSRLPETGWGIPKVFAALAIAAAAVFAALYLLYAMTPEWSEFASGPRLARVAAYAAGRGPGANTAGWSPDPGGLEMVFLYAYVAGGPQSPAVAHLCYLLALPLLMLSYARRAGIARAGVIGALLAFASPVMAVSGSTACTDVAVAAVLFGVFHLLEIWEVERRAVQLALAGLLAGFAGAIAHVGWLGLALAVAVVGWGLLRAKQPLLRPLAVVVACAVLTGGPWLVKEWANRDGSAGEGAPAETAEAGWTLLDIPLFVTTLGSAKGGLAGPVFLLAPLGLLALRRRQGRRLLLAAAVFAVPFACDPTARSLIPALPFIAMSMGIAFSAARVTALVLVGAHLLLSYPKVIPRYCEPQAWRIRTVALRAALRLKLTGNDLEARVPGYRLAVRLDKWTPQDAHIFSAGPLPNLYTSREVLADGRGAAGTSLGDALRVALDPEWRPTQRAAIRIKPQSVAAVRVTAVGGQRRRWILHEMRLFRRGIELPRDPRWRLSAAPAGPEVRLAFDNSPVTFWQGTGGGRAGRYVQVDLGGLNEVDTVVLDMPPRCAGIPLRLEVLDPGGQWRLAPAEVDQTEVARPAGLRRLAARELRAKGFSYLAPAGWELLARDLREKQDQWGVTLAAEADGVALYRIR